MKNYKVSTQFIFKYITIFFVSLVLANATISGLSPFLFAFFFAGLFVGLDEKFLAGFTLVSAFAINPTLESFFVAVGCVAVGLVLFYAFRLSKKRIKLWALFLGFVISQVVYVYYNFYNLKQWVFYLLLGLICVYVFVVVLQVLFLRKNCFKLTLDESICFMFAIALMGAGLSSVFVFDFSVFSFVALTVVLLCVSVGSPSLTFAITLALSLGASITQGSLEIIAEFCLIAMAGSVFAGSHKTKIVLYSLLVELFVRLYFDVGAINLFTFLPFVCSAVLFMFLPNKLLNALKDVVYVKKSDISSRNLINITRKTLRKRMAELSNVFMDMKQIHLNMLKKQLNKEELVAMLTKEVCCSCCKDCIDKSRCTRSLALNNRSALEHLVETAVTKGKISLLDLPAGLTDRCGKINPLISTINRLCDEYKQYKHMMTDINNVKILLADQMGAVARLLLDIGDEIDANVTFDIARENKIISNLLKHNIECKEVLLYTEKQEETSAVVVVKAQAEYAPIVEKVLSNTLKMPMQVSSVVPVENGTFNSITLRKQSKFDCVFGLASCNKAGNEICGDCHSIIRLGANRFLLALCDGMGTGTNAHKMSAMTLGLIENFYKAGFNNEIILESVNKLLAISNQENYSTLDVCLLDLNNQLADFIKVGAPFGFIKRNSNLELVQGGALPIGALDSVSPSTFKTTISTQDAIILVTDGITDAFETVEEMAEFVEKLASTNPQTLAETILNEALHRNGMNAKDDMTVLVARTFLKN